ncbi:MAG: phosphatase PAP2 family protein [Nonlabens sp.]|uniref:phosphatase PAP2 family protein n=1 Tax=Nonlabens sp. TaxID=1888209 RepID=UPI00329730B5
MKFLKNIFTIALLLAVSSLYSQNFKPDSYTAVDVEEMNTWQLLKYDGLNALNGVGYSYLRPFNWQKNDFYRAGATGLLVGGLYTFDNESSDYFRRQEKDVPELIKDFGWDFGSPQNNYGVTAGIYAYGLIAKDPEWRRTGVLMISSATAGGLLQQILKTLTGRARPETDLGRNEFRPFSGESGFRSFPSGHTVLAFTTAYALAKHFDNPFVKAGIYTVGLISPVSRLWAGAHFLTDVVLSMAITIATVEAVDRYLDTRNGYGEKRYGTGKTGQNPKKMVFNITATTNTLGVTLNF